jgi:hypothetical protein
VSAGLRPRANWFRENYDKLALAVVLAALLGSALFLVLQIGRVRKSLEAASWEQPATTPKPALPVDLAQYDGARALLDNPLQARPRQNQMMSSELRVSCVECGKPIPFSAKDCPFCKAQQPAIVAIDEMDSDADGLPDQYERERGFNPADHDDAGLDLDRDGFSNLEEFQSGTDPANPAEYPPPAAKLRLARIGSKPFILRFQGDARLPDGSIRYQLNLRNLERTYFTKIGDEVEGFLVAGYEPDATDGATVVLQKNSTTTRLVKGKTIEQHELVAELVFLVDQQVLRARVGESVSVKGREYKIIDIRRDGVLIRDTETGKDTLVGLLSEAEKGSLLGAAEAVVPASVAPVVPSMPASPPGAVQRRR